MKNCDHIFLKLRPIGVENLKFKDALCAKCHHVAMDHDRDDVAIVDIEAYSRWVDNQIIRTKNRS